MNDGRIKLAIALLVLGLAGLLMEATRLSAARDNNALIQSLQANRHEEVLTSRDNPEVLLAEANFLARHERHDDAVALLNWLAEQGDDRFRAKVWFNLGNQHLRQSLAKVESSQFDQAAAFAEMAKSAYRKALQLDPAFWDCKYNLETASRLLPDIDRLSAEPEDQPEDEQAKRLWTTVPGFPRGLP